MDNPQPTINENPTVLSVDTRRKIQKLEPIFSDATVADLAVRQALAEASQATAGKGVLLMKNMGVDFTASSTKPVPFVYAPLKYMNGDEPLPSPSPTSTYSDTSADDVFEIIRNIQDPEHPLTLEQLGVVSREQITLDHSGRRPRLQVRFTPTVRKWA